MVALEVVPKRELGVEYGKFGLALIVVFVGAKLIYGDLAGKVPISVSLPSSRWS